MEKTNDAFSFCLILCEFAAAELFQKSMLRIWQLLNFPHLHEFATVAKDKILLFPQQSAWQGFLKLLIVEKIIISYHLNAIANLYFALRDLRLK